MIKVVVGRDSKLSAEVVYELLADFGNTSWMKGVANTEVEGEGVGMVRNIFTGPDNPPVREMLTERDDLKRKVAYTIPENNPLPVDNYSAFTIVEEVGDGCRLEWAGSFEARGVDDATAKAMVERMYGVLIGWVLEAAANG